MPKGHADSSTKQLTHGTVTIGYPAHIELPEKAGKLSPAEVAKLPKARRGIGLACEKTAEALSKAPGVKTDVTAAALVTAGAMAEDIDTVIADAEYALVVLKQANNLLDGNAHELLRKVLAAVRAAEKFDPHVAEVFPHLIAYFANKRGVEAPTPAPK
jgi:hypothetical protein